MKKDTFLGFCIGVFITTLVIVVIIGPEPYERGYACAEAFAAATTRADTLQIRLDTDCTIPEDH